MKTDIALAAQLCNNIQYLTEHVEEMKREMFPYKSKVYVTDPRYTGPGTVAPYCFDLPLDKIQVLLDNGNIWQYPFINCKPICS